MYKYYLIITFFIQSLIFIETISLPKRCYMLKWKLHQKVSMNDAWNSYNSLTSLSSTPLWSQSNSVLTYPQTSTIVESDQINNGDDSDDGFELRLRRLNDGVMVDEWYEPGRDYIVILTNRYHLIGFDDATLWLSAKSKQHQMKTEQEKMKCNNSDPSDLGSWIHLSNRHANSLHLRNLWSINAGVTHEQIGCMGLSAVKRYGYQRQITKLITVWRTPLHSNCGCITLNAAVQTRNKHLKFYSAVGGLKKSLCPTTKRPHSPVLPAYMFKEIEQTSADANVHSNNSNMKISQHYSMHMDNMQPQDCCACGTANYKLTFTGLWTKETHPQDWPVHNPGSLHWTNIIGASHSSNFQIYRIGEPASAGVQAVCTYGDTTVIKQALGIAASNTGLVNGVPAGTQRGSTGVGPLHSFISAPGMWSEETMNESRTAYFAVNRTHSLISFLTMLGPSPNWCTGLSGQSVCKADCTWVKKIEIDLFPWDAGAIHGDTYIPKESERKDVPDPIRFINREWMPNSPFTPDLPVARVTVERMLPTESWECTTKLVDGLELFHSDGSTVTIGKKMESQSPVIQSAVGDLTGALPKKSRLKSGRSSRGNDRLPSIADNPLSNPSLAQMATFLCITDSWSAWSHCSVTCGVGRRVRQRVMLVNKKNELCQHVPLKEEEACEGRKRTCDFSATCSLLPWTAWTPCNATCEQRYGQQSRSRYLARANEKAQCLHLFKTDLEKQKGIVSENRDCNLTALECDAVTICGEGRKDGVPCGKELKRYHYSAVEHACLSFMYLGCKGGRNRFLTKEACEEQCLSAVEALPAWRRERMALLQYQTAQIVVNGQMNDKYSVGKTDVTPAKYCSKLMDPGFKCATDNESGENQNTKSQLVVRWYHCARTQRCRQFDYFGCGGNLNNHLTYEDCLAKCLPQELQKLRLMSKARSAIGNLADGTRTQTSDTGILALGTSTNEHSDIDLKDFQKISNLGGPKQDCKLSEWSGWSPCSTVCSEQNGSQMRWRHIEKPVMHGGRPCDTLFDRRQCIGQPC